MYSEGHKKHYSNLKKRKMVVWIHSCGIFPFTFENINYTFYQNRKAGLHGWRKILFRRYSFWLYVEFKNYFLKKIMRIHSRLSHPVPNTEERMFLYSSCSSDFIDWLNLILWCVSQSQFYLFFALFLLQLERIGS